MKSYMAGVLARHSGGVRLSQAGLETGNGSSTASSFGVHRAQGILTLVTVGDGWYPE